MKSTELRIGNLAQDENGNIGIVVAINDERAVLDGVGDCWLGSEIKPIPLTEEILLKCGFITNSGRVFFKDNIGYEFGVTNRAVYKIDDGFILFKHIKHLHQLQNLYFALTGEELNVEL